MKFLKKWFGEAETQDVAANESRHQPTRGPVETPRPHVADDYHDESSFAWLGTGSVSSSMFDSPRQPAGLSLDEEPEQDSGYDPYNTGSFGNIKSTG